MIEVTDAVTRAREYFARLHNGSRVESLRVEEVELSNDEKYWLVTLGYNADYTTVEAGLPEGLYEPPTPTVELAKIPREYRLLKVNAATGHVESMKMRAA